MRKETTLQVKIIKPIKPPTKSFIKTTIEMYILSDKIDIHLGS